MMWLLLATACEPIAPAEASVTSAPIAPAVRFPGPCRAEVDHRNPRNVVPDGITDDITTYTWDADRRLVASRTEHFGASMPRSERYRYDEAGRLTWRRIEVVGAYVQVEQSHRDAAGRLLRVTKGESDSAPRWQSTFHYDDQGRMTLSEESRVGGRVSFRRRFVHDGDRVIREEVDNEGNGTFPLTERHEHDDLGRVVRRIHEWEGRVDNPTQIELFEYDEAGRLVRRIDQRPYGPREDPGTAVELDYDAAGNVLIRQTIRVATGELVNRTVYDYGCWAGLSAADPVPVYLEPWDTVTRLDRPPDVSF